MSSAPVSGAMSSRKAWLSPASKSLLAQSTLYVLAVGCFVQFLIVLYGRFLPWWNQSQSFIKMRDAMTIPFPGNVPVKTKVTVVGDETVVQTIGKNAVLVAGATLYPLTLQWTATLGAALCAAGLLALFQYHRAKLNASKRASVGLPTALVTAKRMYVRSRRAVRAVMGLQLPPYKFWAWWCGGLSVLDALIVVFWVSVASNYLSYNITTKFARVEAQYNAPPPPSVAGAPPPSASALAAAATNAANAIAIRKLDQAGKAFGEVLRLMMVLLYYPVSRSNVLAWLFRTDHSTLVRYHRWFGYATIGIAFFHGLLYAVEWGSQGVLYDKMLYWQPYSRPYLPGLISLIGGLIIVATGATWMRRSYYWVFYWSHIFGFLLWTVFAMIHYKAFMNFIAPGLVLYLLDRSLRYWQLATNRIMLGPGDVTVNGPVVTVRLAWSKGAVVSAGQTLYLRCGAISHLDSHPFTIASVSAGGDGQGWVAVVHIKVMGPWTRKLKELAESGARLCMQVEGPYESTLLHEPKTSVVVMVAGGIGFTPLKGLLDHYLALGDTHTLYHGPSDALSPSDSMTLSASNAASSPSAMQQHLPVSQGSNEMLSVELRAPLSSPTPFSIDSSTAPASGCLCAQPHVYLQWASRTIAELQLLGAPLLRAAINTETASAAGKAGAKHQGAPSGWLTATLHYTGNGLDVEAHQQGHAGKKGLTVTADASSAPDGATPTATSSKLPKFMSRMSSMMSVGSSTSSPESTTLPTPAPTGYWHRLVATTALAPSPAIQPVVFSVCCILSLAGSFAGLVLAWWYDGYKSRTTSHGANWAGVATIQFLAMTAGGIFPPLVYLAGYTLLRPLLPNWLAGYGFTLSRAGSADHGSLLTSPHETTGGSWDLDGSRSVAVLPGYRLAPSHSEEMGEGHLQLHRTRPNIRDMLGRVCEAHPEEAEVEVLVGGPPALYHEAVEACQAMNLRHLWGLRGPLLTYRSVAHQH